MFTELYLLGTALKKSALVQASKNTIMHTSKLKSISKYQFVDLWRLWFFVLHFKAGEI